MIFSSPLEQPQPALPADPLAPPLRRLLPARPPYPPYTCLHPHCDCPAAVASLLLLLLLLQWHRGPARPALGGGGGDGGWTILRAPLWQGHWMSGGGDEAVERLTCLLGPVDAPQLQLRDGFVHLRQRHIVRLRRCLWCSTRDHLCRPTTIYLTRTYSVPSILAPAILRWTSGLPPALVREMIKHANQITVYS